MSVANLSCLLTGALAIFSAGAPKAGGRQSDVSAFELFSRTMRPTHKTNVVAIIVQRESAGESSFQQVKIIRSKQGQQRWTVLQPVRLAGIDSVDDGNRWRLYIPDMRQITDAESPSKSAGSYRTLSTLAKRNYTFQYSPRTVVAGREAVCVTATPRNTDLEVIRYFIDRETEYSLRAESIGEDGRPATIFDTKFVQYPPKLDAAAFKMSTLPKVKVFTYNPPIRMTKSQAKAKVGFVPLVPGGLPLGFKVVSLQYNDDPEWRSVMVRATDGIHYATIYQWIPDDNIVRALANSTPGEYNGIKMLLVSRTLGPKIRGKLLQAFIAQATSDDDRAFRITNAGGPSSPHGSASIQWNSTTVRKR